MRATTFVGRMNLNRRHFWNWWIFFVMGMLMLIVSGCTSKHAKTSEDNTKNQPAANKPSDQHFDGGTYCVQTIMQGPPVTTPIHFSNKITESDPSLKSKDFEAELSGDALDITYHERWLATDDDRKFIEDSRKFNDPRRVMRDIHDGFAEDTFINHYTRSNESAWSVGVTGMVQGGTPWGLFIYKPTVTRVGAENINGYDTIKYAVDTTHESELDKSPGLLAGGLKDYNIIGTAWVFKDANCVLQYDIQYEQDSKDGKVSKTHYEGTVTKK